MSLKDFYARVGKKHEAPRVGAAGARGGGDHLQVPYSKWRLVVGSYCCGCRDRIQRRP